MFEKAIDGDAVSLNHVEDAIRHARLLHQFGEEDADGRDPFRMASG